MNVLEVKSVHKRYGTKPALRGIDLAVEGGYLVGLVGPNGAGKTTLIKSILNLVGIDSGSITIFGMDHRNQEREVRRRIGFVHEASYLFEDLSPLQHERIVRQAYPAWDHDRYVAYLEQFALPTNAKVKTFSKGMRMRLSLAMALSHDARLILMDEPSSGLDPVVRHELMELIATELENERRTFLFSTHITSDLDRVADYVVVMLDGRIALSAARHDLDERYALCRGGLELLGNGSAQLFTGVKRSEFGFVALAKNRNAVSQIHGENVVIERPTIEDLVVHLAQEERDESPVR